VAAAEAADAAKTKRRRRLLLVGIGVPIAVASVVIVASIFQESGEGRDLPEAIASSPPSEPGPARTIPPAPGGGPSTPGSSSSSSSPSSPPTATPPPDGAAPAPSASSPSADQPPPGAAPTAAASSPGPSGASPDAGASSKPGSPAPSRASGTGPSRASARAAHTPARDGGAADPPDAAKTSSRATALAGGEGNGAPPSEAASPDGGARPPARAAARGRLIGGVAAAPQPNDPAGANAKPSGPGARPAPPTALERKFAALERSRSEEENALRQVDRFVPTGGVTLQGRVVDADGGKAIAGSVVHVHHDGTLVEGTTDAGGTFKLPGMVAGSHVVVWVGRPGDPYIDERLELAVPAEGQTVEAGTLKLLRGNELTARLEGWVGLFIDRRGSQIVVAGVSPWTPADEAHLEVGDQIVSIDGREVVGLGPRATTFLLRGRVGTSVALVVRQHGGQRRKVTLTRAVR
jgi:hypothetical protein